MAWVVPIYWVWVLECDLHNLNRVASLVVHFLPSTKHILLMLSGVGFEGPLDQPLNRPPYQIWNQGTHHLFHGIRRFPSWFPLLQIAPGLFLNACQMLMVNHQVYVVCSYTPGQNSYPKGLGLPAHKFQVRLSVFVTPENGQRTDPSLSDMMKVFRHNNTSHPRHAPNLPYSPRSVKKN